MAARSTPDAPRPPFDGKRALSVHWRPILIKASACSVHWTSFCSLNERNHHDHQHDNATLANHKGDIPFIIIIELNWSQANGASWNQIRPTQGRVSN